jgi:DUF1009 family protein
MPDSAGTTPRSDVARLGIIAGSGVLPLAVAEAARSNGQPVHILGFAGLAEPGIEAYSHDWMKWGQIGRMLRLLRTNGCTELVIVGGVRRPRITHIRPDIGFFRKLPAALRATRGGDDSVLGGIVRFFEREGFRVRGAHEIATNLTAPQGLLAGAAPSAEALADIAHGLAVVRALGALDVGQAAVVARGYVLGVEAAEGTDALLQRCASLRQWGLKRRAGVLVKAPKPGQELRIDMPAIGPRTVDNAAAAGLAGIAIASHRVLLADPEALVAAAERHGLFVIGIDADIADAEG